MTGQHVGRRSQQAVIGRRQTKPGHRLPTECNSFLPSGKTGDGPPAIGRSPQTMANRPELTGHTTDAHTWAPTRLLPDEGRPESVLTSDAERALAERAVAAHAMALPLGEHELQQLEALIDMQRWRR